MKKNHIIKWLFLLFLSLFVSLNVSYSQDNSDKHWNDIEKALILAVKKGKFNEADIIFQKYIAELEKTPLEIEENRIQYILDVTFSFICINAPHSRANNTFFRNLIRYASIENMVYELKCKTTTPDILPVLHDLLSTVPYDVLEEFIISMYDNNINLNQIIQHIHDFDYSKYDKEQRRNMQFIHNNALLSIVRNCNYAPAWFELGYRAEMSYGFPNDSSRLATAFEYYSKASETGNEFADMRLAFLYAFGLGCDKDIRKSYELVSPLQDEIGFNAYGAYTMGWHYASGTNGETDILKAMECYMIAAEYEMHPVLRKQSLKAAQDFFLYIINTSE